MDIRLIENSNGGDMVFENGDIQLISEVYQQPYLSHFGGNKEMSTGDIVENEGSNNDWWGNSLLTEQPNCQLNSSFEKALAETPLSSSGRITLERIASEDLEYLSGFAESQSSVVITNVDKIKLTDNIAKENSVNFSYIWDSFKDEILN